eukprot:364639-Chlamydomonas_euryale.AAC.50
MWRRCLRQCPATAQPSASTTMCAPIAVFLSLASQRWFVCEEGPPVGKGEEGTGFCGFITHVHVAPPLPGLSAVQAIGKALGKEPQVVLYDPSAIGTGKSGKADGFPFRTIHFFASSDKAKRELGWQPKHDFLGDAEACVRDYLASGRQNQDIDFSTDTKIMQLMVEHGMATA